VSDDGYNIRLSNIANFNPNHKAGAVNIVAPVCYERIQKLNTGAVHTQNL